MAKTSSIHIRVESQIKEEVKKILKNLGMTSTEAINIYLRQIIFHSGIPFEIKMQQFSDEMVDALSEAQEIEKHPENYPVFESVDDFMEDLHNEIQNRKN